MKPNRAMNVEEVASELNIAKNTVYELIKRGELRSYKVGRKVRIDSVDLDEYIRRSKEEVSGKEISYEPNNQNVTELKAESPMTFVNSGNMTIPNQFVISGQDILLDVLANTLTNHPEGTQTLRSYVGSYRGLLALYLDQCQVAAIHLYDSATGEYNTPFVRYFIYGTHCVLINLAKRRQGFYVQKGNPKNIRSWTDLIREDVRFVNREKGSGTRILLDGMILENEIEVSQIKGYYNEKTSHMAVANAIASKQADVGLGAENSAIHLPELDFVPLHTERYDLVVKKENLADPVYKVLYDILTSKEFLQSVNHLGTYDFSELGQIVSET